jgi:hypothetical protein
MAFRSQIHVSGAGTIVPARPGTRIKVLQLVVWAHEATTLTLKDGNDPINPDGFNMPAQTSFVLDGEPLVLGVSNALKLTTTNGLVTGWVQYTFEGFQLPS